MSILPNIYVVTRSPEVFLSELPGKTIGFCIVVDAGRLTMEDMSGVYNFFADAVGEHPFCFLIGNKTGSENAGIENIIPFFFLPSYRYQGPSPIVFVRGEYVPGIETISKEAEKQGLGPLCILKAGGNEMGDTEQWLRDKYLKMISSVNEDQYIIAETGSIKEAEEIIGKCENIEKEIEKEVSQSLSAAKQAKQLNDVLYSSTRRNNALQKKVQAQEVTISLLRSDHRAKEIQEYYNREYEVLPLWYKRLGHLLKAATGKRKGVLNKNKRAS